MSQFYHVRPDGAVSELRTGMSIMDASGQSRRIKRISWLQADGGDHEGMKAGDWYALIETDSAPSSENPDDPR